MKYDYVPPPAFSQVTSLRDSLMKTKGLIFGEPLSSGVIEQLIAGHAKRFRNRIFSLSGNVERISHSGDEPGPLLP